jgi:hypothetical protein
LGNIGGKRFTFTLAPPRQKFKKVKDYFGFFRFLFLRIVPRGTLGGLLNENGSHLEVGMIIAQINVGLS